MYIKRQCNRVRSFEKPFEKSSNIPKTFRLDLAPAAQALQDNGESTARRGPVRQSTPRAWLSPPEVTNDTEAVKG